MKRRLFFLSLLMIGGGNLVSAQKMGINTNSPKATLDIKNEGNNTEVLRFSSKPLDLPSTNKNFVLFIGEEIDSGYNLRKISLADLISNITSEVPTLKRIVIKNNKRQTFKNTRSTNPTQQQFRNTEIDFGEEVINTSSENYTFNATDNYIEIKKAGVYDVSA